MPSKVNLPPEPLWYKDAVIYELHVRAFNDGDGNGVGDFRGLTQKLDYLQDLGVSAVWLLPFCPSPLRDDGYDISDYGNIHPNYGTLADFRAFLREAHKRDIRVITELVVNHTSDQHPWFQRARRAKPGSTHRDYYVWSDTPKRYEDARIIFKDFETSNWTWDPVAGAYFWHRFYSHQPDLNFEHPEVRKALKQVLDFWLAMGVDGLRLDAVPYLYERDGTNCENLPETHAFLKELRRHLDSKFQDKLLLAEANQWPEDAAAYFGDGDECHMAFHFPIMPRMFMSIHMEDRFPIVDILRQTPAIHDTCQWAVFLRNHDELTLEMVTDEERDYMYRVYANDPQARINLGIRRRLAPLLGNNRRKIELMNGLLFSLPGTPVLYYGDEIGMGDNMYLGDRNGVRTPMQWSPDRNAGFSRANPQKLYLPIIIDPEYHYESLNVEAQSNNPNSLLWWMKRLIGLRKRSRAFGRGTLEFLHPENRKVLAFLRQHENETILVVANLSRFAQAVELDLKSLEGKVPVEMFGRTEFPPIGELPYFITLGPHGFYWFSIEPKRESISAGRSHGPLKVPVIEVTADIDELFEGRSLEAIESALPGFLASKRWFAGKARRTKNARVTEVTPVNRGEIPGFLTFVEVEYTEGDPETYLLPMSVARRARADQVQKTAPNAVIAQLRWALGGEVGVLYDASGERAFTSELLEAMARRRRFKGAHGDVHTASTRVLRDAREGTDTLEPSALKAEQSNTSVIYGDRLILKLFRKLAEGVNPDLEIGRFLTEKTSFQQISSVAGWLEYRRDQGGRVTLGILREFVPNEGDAWRYTLDHLARYFEGVVTRLPDLRQSPPPTEGRLLQLVDRGIPESAGEMIGEYFESARKLGQRTAELHAALASSTDDLDFAPEPFTMLYQRSVYQSMRNLTTQVMDTLRKRLSSLPAPLQEEVRHVIGLESEIVERHKSLLKVKVEAMRIRVHGDYHLGQVLFTGDDFVIIDFEGEPSRALGERRLKRNALRDVAGMLRSFHYAAHTAMLDQISSGVVRREDQPLIEPWAAFWQGCVSAIFLKAYLDTAQGAVFMPETREELEALLTSYLLDKAVYELGYEIANRPDWLRVPLRGVERIVRGEAL